MHLLALFCQPIDFNTLLPDLGMETLSFVLPIILAVVWAFSLKQAGSIFKKDLLPLIHLCWMNLVVLGNLLSRLESTDGFKAGFGFELGVVSFAFCFHLVSRSYSLTPKNFILTAGPFF
jgi:hypothetical protein